MLRFERIWMPGRQLGVILLLIFGCNLPGAAQGLPSFSDYVVQSMCLDEAGQPSSRLPIDADCLRTRLQRGDDQAVYRKHDWPNRLGDPATTLGYQASDSVLEIRSARPVVVQTFDFGTDGRAFGRFDGARGDGGQVLLFVGDWATFAMTEDGSGGVQWFIGETCRSGAEQDARFLSWLVFRRELQDERWNAAVARLNITASPDICPGDFNDAFTRYKRDRIEFPFRIIDRRGDATLVTRSLQTIVSEHYGGRAIDSADHLERFYFARGLGLIRWERWANGSLGQPGRVREAAHQLGQTTRCPRVDGYGAPGARWLLADCRTWTSLVRQTSPWSVRDYRWNALKALGESD